MFLPMFFQRAGCVGVTRVIQRNIASVLTTRTSLAPRVKRTASLVSHQNPLTRSSLASTSARFICTTSTSQKQSRPVAQAIPYSGPALHGVAPDVVLNGVLNLNEDEKYWVPQMENVWYRPLLFSLSSGYFVVLLRVRKSGILSRHRHTGAVHAATLKGKWHYLEHDWWATPGSYSYEPPGDIHTLEIPEGVDEMVTLFHVTGSYTYVEPDGTVIGSEDVFSQYETAREHYIGNGVGEEYLKTLVR